MDPDTIFKNLLESIIACDVENAKDSLDALLDWINTDGYVPERLNDALALIRGA